MLDTPFYRGFNLMDWWFAVTLQSAVDWDNPSTVKQVADTLGWQAQTVYTFPNDNPAGVLIPALYVIQTTNLVFVVSQSTHTPLEWIGNALGSIQNVDPKIDGNVSIYFDLVANTQLAASLATILSYLPGRQLVLIGFSLGAASIAIMKELLAHVAHIDSACILFGCPRVGDAEWAAGFPSANAFRLIAINDPVGSVPPVVWTKVGAYYYWTPLPTLTDYAHVQPSYLLSLPSNVSPGDYTIGTTELIASFDSGLFQQYHNQSFYGRILRGGLPQIIPDDFEGYPGSGTLDSVCQTVFDFSPVGWPFGAVTTEQPIEEFSTMGVQGVIYFRDTGSASLGFQEVYYFTGTDVAALSTTLGNLAAQRANFLSKSVEMFAYRASIVGGPRQSYLTKLVTPIGGKISTDTDKIEAAITYFGYSTGRLHKRQFHFRGIASSWIDTDALTATGRGNLGLIESYLAGAAQAGVSILVKKGTMFGNMTGASQPTANSPITISTDSTGPALPAGTPITITGCKGAPLLNGSWLSVGTPTVANQITLSGSQRYSAPLVLQGKVFVQTPTYVAMNEWAINGVTSHKTGKPSFLQRGRQSAQLKHR